MSERIELGWMNLVPCTRVRMVTIDGPFGTKFDVPRVETAEQRLYAYADIESPNWRPEAAAIAKDCATAALAAAGGIGAVTMNPGAAAASFAQAFLACFVARMADVAISSVHLETSTVCVW